MEYNLDILKQIANCDYVRPGVIGPMNSPTMSAIIFNAVWIDSEGGDIRAEFYVINQMQYDLYTI